MTIRALIIDDERLARNRLRRLLEQLSVQVLGEGENGEQAVALCHQFEVDVVFLDINMPVLNGLAAAQQISQMRAEAPSIVFCTAYDEFALEAFSANASAYLVKPVNIQDLERALEQAAKINRLQASRAAIAEPLDADVLPSLSIATAGTMENVPFTAVAYFRSHEKNVFAYILGQGEVLVDFTLKELQHQFADCLVRTHRSTLVNIEKIQKLSRDSSGASLLYLKEIDTALPVSRRHLAAVKQCF